MSEIKTSEQSVKHNFSGEEKKELAKTIAEKVSKKHEVEDDKKATMSSFKSTLDTLEMEINSCANKIQDGYEMRLMECREERDYKRKVVNFYRIDTGELVQQRPMSSDEMQLQLLDE